jgi:hypothetical protein
MDEDGDEDDLKPRGDRLTLNTGMNMNMGMGMGVGSGHSQAETEGARALSALGAAGIWDNGAASGRGYGQSQERDRDRGDRGSERLGSGENNNGDDTGAGGGGNNGPEDIDPSLTGMSRGPGFGLDLYPGGSNALNSGGDALAGPGSNPTTTSGGFSPHGGVGLARMVVDAVMRVGPATGPPAPQGRRDSNLMMMLPSLSGLGNYAGSTNAQQAGEALAAGLYPTSHQRGPQEESNARGAFSPARSARGDDPAESDAHNARKRRGRPVDIPALPPPAAVDRLVQVYVDFVQIMLPILHMPTFREMLVRVRDRAEDVSEADIFFVLMVLALSTMALSRSLDPTAELRMSSEAFYLEAVKHLEAVFEESDSLIGLQAILLFCYYSLLNPTRGSESEHSYSATACSTLTQYGSTSQASGSSSDWPAEPP